jgi:hypothetical protein
LKDRGSGAGNTGDNAGFGYGGKRNSKMEPCGKRKSKENSKKDNKKNRKET